MLRWQCLINNGNLYLINNVGDILVYLWFNVCNLIIPMCFPAVFFLKNPQLNIIAFQNYKHWYLIHTRSDKAFMVTALIRAYSNLCMEGHYAYDPFKRIFREKWKRFLLNLNWNRLPSSIIIFYKIPFCNDWYISIFC